MARRQKLKVFRTAVGFHDAYVAAPSRKAALEAWGSDSDLFAQGMAEAVTDPALMEEALAAPGKVIRRSRGSADEQLAALARSAPASRIARKPRSPKESSGDERPPATARFAQAGEVEAVQRKRPRPSRAALEKAEKALAAAGRRHAADRKVLADRQAALAREGRILERRHQTESARLERNLERVRNRYKSALEDWARS